MKLLLFPNQLFEKKYLPKSVDIILLVEDPVFFGFRESKYNFNKLKLVLHRASMKSYEKYLQKEGCKVQYIEFAKVHKTSFQNMTCFELNDYFLEKKYSKKITTILPTPNFLMTTKDLEEFHKTSGKKKFIHRNFLQFVKRKLNLLVDEKSHDMENRKKIPKGMKIPPLPHLPENSHVTEAKSYIERNFPNNYGSTNNFIYPISHNETKSCFQVFLSERMEHFGAYEDAICSENNFLFHSINGPLMNIGLINPQDVLDMLQKHSIKMNNYEGFIRQVVGWREYQRYCYRYGYKEMKEANIFHNSKKLSKKWYTGSLGVEPVDNAIRDAFQYGYLHHIVRLMVICNFMNLNGIHPHEVYRWFMEFSVDSYDWVMIQNVYSMGMWADGGLTMRKPYISSDNYIQQMSNYKCGDWCVKWKNLYYQFLVKHQDILRKTPYGRNIKSWENKSEEEKKKIMAFRL